MDRIDRIKEHGYKRRECMDDVIIKNQYLSTGESLEFTPSESKLLFVTEGLIVFTRGRYKPREVTSPSMLLLPVGERVIIKTRTGVKFMIMRLCFHIPISDQLSNISTSKKEISSEKEKTQKASFPVLPVNWIIQTFLRELDLYVSAGLSSSQFMELKMQELVYMLKEFYAEDELRQFFEPILSNDRLFSDFILQNYHKTKSVAELAELSCYSFSGFEKRFKKVFGMPASRWLKQKRATDIYQEISKGEKTFKQISNEYGFCSPAHFNDFCRMQLGHTPGELRKLQVNKILL